MNSVKMNRSELLDIVRGNAVKHAGEYEEAVNDYRVAVEVVAKANLKIAKTGDLDKFKNFEHFPARPQSYVKDYQRAIRMLELSVEDVIEIEEHIFNQLVLDEWAWKQSFSTANAAYKSYLG